MVLQEHLKFSGKPTVDFIASLEYGRLQQVVDAEVKRISRKGVDATVQKVDVLS